MGRTFDATSAIVLYALTRYRESEHRGQLSAKLVRRTLSGSRRETKTGEARQTLNQNQIWRPPDETLERLSKMPWLLCNLCEKKYKSYHRCPEERHGVYKKTDGNLIYLASPYSDEEPFVMNARWKSVRKYASNLIELGYLVFSPVVYQLHYGLPKDFSFWKSMDFKMIEAADEVWILKLKGWNKSVGVVAEMNYAVKLGKPIRFVTVNDNPQ